MQLCIMKAVIYVKEHLGTKIHVEELAQIVNLSRSYFSVNFKKYTGMAVNEFVRQERVRAAQILLVERDDLVSDIAQKIGYEDVNYFIRVFCELTGITPGEYRKQNGRR
jgi:two-component system response regulator YesN